ncbi:MAG TPA: hypothetical protein VF666_07260 [Pyrinomonadaceae bacterium]
MKRRESQYVAAKHVAVGRLVMIVAAACLCLALTEAATRAQTSDAKGEGTMGVVMVTTSSADAVRQLTSRDALVRKRAAEDLARMADTEQRRLVEGYRLQEKDGRVRVALDWALYRMGKAEALYNLVRALDSSRFDQASVYLGELETPEPLYIFLERTNGNTQIKLLQVLAHMGDAATLARIKPLADSLDPLIAQAAREAAHDITTRLAETPPATPATPARPRQTRNRDEDEHAEETSPQQ